MLKAFTAFLAAASVLFAAAPSPAQDDSMTLSLRYDGKLLVKVFDLRVEQRVTPSGFSSSARFQSYGILAAFRRLDMRATSTGRIAGGDARPGTFWFKNFGGKTKRAVTVRWTGNDVAMSAEPPYGGLGEPPANRAQKLSAADPLTQLMRMTLNASRADVCTRTTRFFDGKQLYALHFSNPRAVTPGGREKRLGLINGMRCDVRFEELAGFKAKPPGQRDQGLKYGITVDFGQAGQGGPWVLSAVRGSTPLGRAAIELAGMTVTGRDPTA
jgi:hypothetical protein